MRERGIESHRGKMEMGFKKKEEGLVNFRSQPAIFFKAGGAYKKVFFG